MDLQIEHHAPLLIQSRPYNVWQLIKLFWKSQHKWFAYLFFSIIIFLTITIVGLELALSYWINYFYNALQAYDMKSVIKLLFIFCGLAAIFTVVQVYRYYLSQLFALRWRNWLTSQFISRWLEKRGYYYLEMFDNQTDNPDQRIQEDVNGLISLFISLTVGFVGAITTFIAFIYVLWSLSGSFTLHLGALGTYTIHGDMVWIAIIYNLIGTLITFRIGYPLVKLNFEQQQREATFRFSAIDLRSHGEQVALYQGENHQKSILNFHFLKVLQNWYAIVLRQKLLLWFTASFNQAAVILPFLAALPNYFSKTFLLGGLMQSIRAFSSIQDSLSFFINSYTQIADWRATGSRLITFLNHLHELENHVERQDHVSYQTQNSNNISIKNLSIKTKENHFLLEDLDINFLHGKNYVIKGPSGIGKSTLIKTIAGIWPYATGEIHLPKNKAVMYLPQKPYMPMGTLAEAVLFPDKTNKELESRLTEVLRECNLEQFIPRLQETARWSEVLSPGEQQRIAIARVLLHKPDWVFLDESTSMLDIANESNLYHVLQQKLPHCTIISIAHHPSVEAYHDEVIDVTQFSHEMA